MFYSQQLYLIAFDDMYLNVKLKRCRVKKKLMLAKCLRSITFNLEIGFIEIIPTLIEVHHKLSIRYWISGGF